MNKFLLLIKVSRPISYFVGGLLFLAGFVASNAVLNWLVFINLLGLAALPIVVFGINDVYDYETDRRSARKPSKVEGFLLPKEQHKFVLYSARISSIIALVAAAFVSIVLRNFTNFLATAAVVVLAYAYSTPPLRLKERPPLDSLSNAAGVWLLLLIGFSHNGTLFEMPLKLLYASMGVAAVHAMGAVMDFSADRAAGIKTIATSFSKRAAALFALTIMLGIIFFSGIVSWPLRLYMWLTAMFCAISFAYPNEKLVRLLFSRIGLVAFCVAVSTFVLQQFYK